MAPKNKTRLTENDEVNFIYENIEELIFSKEKWKIIIADDDVDVHNVTKLILKDFRYEGKELEFISTYSCEETKKAISENQNVALILLDIVMEKDNSGFEIIKFIREQLDNKLIRIIIRTGNTDIIQEESAILNYDINDFKEKTDLTSTKLNISLTTALRAYSYTLELFNQKKSLEKVILQSTSILKASSNQDFIDYLFDNSGESVSPEKNNNSLVSSVALKVVNNTCQSIRGTGEFSECKKMKVEDFLPSDVVNKINEFIYEKKLTDIYKNYYLICFNNIEVQSLIVIKTLEEVSEIGKDLLSVFYSHLGIAFDNISLTKEIKDTQKEIIFTLGEIAEARSRETGFHVKRVAEFSKIIAIGYGLSEEEAELIKNAAPMHDIGKLAIPDIILNKPSKLTEEEFEIMKSHSIGGYEMLKSSTREIVKSAAIIALEHHEKYDGTGYPQGLKGDEIHLYGRITAIADVFDALGCNRVYKKAWDLDKIFELFILERGKHFDPVLVDVFFKNIDKLIEIRESFPDL